MIKVSSGDEREACEKIKEFVNVVEVSIVYGDYDLIAKLQTRDLEELDFVTEEIQIDVFYFVSRYII